MPPVSGPAVTAALRAREKFGKSTVPWREICGRIVDGLPATIPENSLHRWVASTLLRLALIYSRRVREERLLDELLQSTEEALERSGEWREVLP